MPLKFAIPPTVSVDAVERELEYARRGEVQDAVDVGCYGAWGIARDVERPKAAISELLRHPNVLGIKAFLSRR